MSGIINYFHSESGTVRDCWWQLSGEVPTFVMEIEGDPHRTMAYDYGSDIGIDPQIASGDAVIYLRLEDTTGIWVNSACQSETDLERAVARVLKNRRYIESWRDAKGPEAYIDIAREIFKTRGEPLRITSTRAGYAAEVVLAEGWAMLALTFGDAQNDRPRAASSFFLSHAAEDSLLARRIFEDLQNDAGADIWFDMAQPVQEIPKDNAAIRDWLRQSIHNANGFVVLWTEHAARSAWVKQEFKWAHELGRGRSSFHLMVLKLRDIQIPAELRDACTVIDCNGIWWSNGLNEELYAAVFNRQSRRTWLAASPRGALATEGTTIGYDDFVSDAGIVVAFDWSFADMSRPHSLQWQLRYERKDGTLLRAVGGGSDRAADLSMKPGDQVGFYKVRWRHGRHFLNGPELWMRSSILGLTSDMVLDHYYSVLKVG